MAAQLSSSRYQGKGASNPSLTSKQHAGGQPMPPSIGNQSLLSRLEDSFTSFLPAEQEMISHTRARKNWARVRKIIRMNATLNRIRNQMQTDGEYRKKAEQRKLTRRDKLKIAYKHFIKSINYTWLILRPLLVVYSIIIIPYRFAYVFYTTYWTVLDIACDSLFLIAALNKYIHARSALKTSVDPKPVYKDKASYLMLFAIVVNFPSELIYPGCIAVKSLRIFNINIVFKFTQRLMHYSKKSKILHYLVIFGNMIKILIILLILLHIAACYWIWLASTKSDYGDWMRFWPPGADPTDADKYIQAIFFMTQVLSAVGYGDSPPVSNQEMFYVMILDVFKSVLYAQIIYGLKGLILVLYQKDIMNRKEREELLVWYINRNQGTNRNMYSKKRINKDLLIFLREAKRKDINGILKTNSLFGTLSFELQRNVLTYLLGDTVKQFDNFFEGLSLEFKFQALQEFIALKVPADQHLFVSKKVCDGVYFIVDGIVQEVSEEGEVVHKVFSKGSLIGLRQVLYSKKDEHEYTTTVVVDAYYIPRNAFIMIAKTRIEDYNELKRRSLAEISKPSFEAPKPVTIPNFFQLLGENSASYKNLTPNNNTPKNNTPKNNTSKNNTPRNTNYKRRDSFFGLPDSEEITKGRSFRASSFKGLARTSSNAESPSNAETAKKSRHFEAMRSVVTQITIANYFVNKPSSFSTNAKEVQLNEPKEQLNEPEVKIERIAGETPLKNDSDDSGSANSIDQNVSNFEDLSSRAEQIGFPTNRALIGLGKVVEEKSLSEISPSYPLIKSFAEKELPPEHDNSHRVDISTDNRHMLEQNNESLIINGSPMINESALRLHKVDFPSQLPGLVEEKDNDILTGNMFNQLFGNVEKPKEADLLAKAADSFHQDSNVDTNSDKLKLGWPSTQKIPEISESKSNLDAKEIPKSRQIEEEYEYEEVKHDENDENLNSSFEMPIEAVLCDEALFDDEYFSIEEISKILEAKMQFLKINLERTQEKISQQIQKYQKTLAVTEPLL